VRVAATGAAVWSVAALFFSVVPSFATEKIGISNLAVLGAVLFTQIDAGRKLAPDSTSPVV